jgi:hypothetical protein
LDAADFDDSGSIDISDAIGLLRYSFIAGMPPAAPFPVFEAGVTILGDTNSKGILIVERGAQIFAVGTETHPVVFTSD